MTPRFMILVCEGFDSTDRPFRSVGMLVASLMQLVYGDLQDNGTKLTGFVKCFPGPWGLFLNCFKSILAIRLSFYLFPCRLCVKRISLGIFAHNIFPLYGAQ